MFESIKQFRKKLADGQFCLGPGITFSDSTAVEALGRVSDFFWIDLEHTALNLETLQNHLIAARAVATPALVRVPSAHVSMIKRVLDTGAAGIIVPQIRTAAEVREVVATCRYHPVGNRGFGPRRASDYGMYDSDNYIADANEHLFICVQIENTEALRNLDEILKVPALDCIVVGPYDLSGSMGLMGQVHHPEVTKAVSHIVSQTRRAGLYAGMGMGAEEEFPLKAAAMGAHWVQCGSDLGYMQQRAADLFARIRSRWSATPAASASPKSPN
ncbi:MAG TPA: aldolase/citrate lyase family protein [Verrucomicrobiae bacterium]|jgi:2-dehydro-3-deoxyglucarate aldolase/4-hydroxy-2-oxoheptanedioate aldolase|nr:aldolase/citrate lyase family protein [Verrucomicrobiae bacterium]